MFCCEGATAGVMGVVCAVDPPDAAPLVVELVGVRALRSCIGAGIVLVAQAASHAVIDSSADSRATVLKFG